MKVHLLALWSAAASEARRRFEIMACFGMKQKRRRASLAAALHMVFGFLLTLLPAQADQIQMQNGDRYFGRVVSVSSNTVVWQSEMLGSVTLARDKIASITFGTNVPVKSVSVTSAPPATAKSPAPTTVTPGVPAQLRTSPQAVKQIEDQFLAGATPEAKAKFNEMVNGLMTGQLSVNDIRAQAKSAADQLRTARRDLGDEAGDVLDGYLAILDSFLQETESGVPSKVPARTPKLKPAPLDE